MSPPDDEPQGRHRRFSCDELLVAVSTSDGPDPDSELADPDGLLGSDAINTAGGRSESPPVHTNHDIPRRQQRRAFFIRTLALLCVCSLSIGSHYASHILGPLKSRLSREIGTSHTDFSLLISAFSLNSTWTPLIGGLLASRLGTTLASIVATGTIFLGQILLLLGDIWGNVRLMVLGLFIFGLGISPLAVVQETIIVRFFKSRGLGVSMAFGLIAGKGASFVSARISYPLTERFGPRAPFYVATFLAGMSVVVNLVYIAASNWLIEGGEAELEAADINDEAQRRSVTNISEAQALEKVAAKRKVKLRHITRLGDVFWAYIGLNILCGMIWAPFNHLAANIIETRYQMPERDASTQASYLLAGSLILYPICGFLVDRFKHRPIVVQLLLMSSCLTLFAYVWLALPPSWTQSPIPAITAFAAGHGFSPLLLVVIVPKIVPLKYVSTALGAHKSLEQTGSTLFQTFAGIALDIRKGAEGKGSKIALQHLLNIFLSLNLLQLLSILGLTCLQRRKAKDSSSGAKAGREEEQPLLMAQHPQHAPAGRPDPLENGQARRLSQTTQKGEVWRGRIFMVLSAISIAFTWILFLGTAWFRLGKTEGGHKLV